MKRISRYVHMNATMTTIMEIIVNQVVPPVFFRTLSRLFFDIWVRSRFPIATESTHARTRVHCVDSRDRTSVDCSSMPFSSSSDLEK